MATEYIKRQSALNIVCYDDCEDCPDGGCDMYRRLKRLTAADVRPVVLCRDCKHYNPNSMEWKCDCVGGLVEPYEDDFCSYGEVDMREVKTDD